MTPHVSIFVFYVEFHKCLYSFIRFYFYVLIGENESVYLSVTWRSGAKIFKEGPMAPLFPPWGHHCERAVSFKDTIVVDMEQHPKPLDFQNIIEKKLMLPVQKHQLATDNIQCLGISCHKL